MDLDDIKLARNKAVKSIKQDQTTRIGYVCYDLFSRPRSVLHHGDAYISKSTPCCQS